MIWINAKVIAPDKIKFRIPTYQWRRNDFQVGGGQGHHEHEILIGRRSHGSENYLPKIQVSPWISDIQF